MAQQMRALMAPTPVALPGTASVHEAARARRDAEMGDVIVPEHTQVCGMVTDRAIVVRTVAEAQDPATPPLADLCSHAYVTVPPPTASSRRCGACTRLPCAACPESTGGT